MRGSKSASRGLLKERKFDQKRVEPPMKRLPYFHSQAFAVGLAPGLAACGEGRIDPRYCKTGSNVHKVLKYRITGG